MAGCYGVSREDTAFERDMHNWMDRQETYMAAFEERVSDNENYLIEQACKREGAEELALQWELLANDQSEVIRLAAECHAAVQRDPFHDAAYTALGRDICKLVMERITSVAEFMAKE